MIGSFEDIMHTNYVCRCRVNSKRVCPKNVSIILPENFISVQNFITKIITIKKVDLGWNFKKLDLYKNTLFSTLLNCITFGGAGATLLQTACQPAGFYRCTDMTVEIA